jgi:ubiquitin C
LDDDETEFTIFIMHENAERILHFPFRTQGSETVGSVKAKIQDRIRTPVDQLQLSYKGRQLQDLVPLSEYDIKQAATLDAKKIVCGSTAISSTPPAPPVSFELCASVSGGRLIKLQVRGTDSIDDVRATALEMIGAQRVQLMMHGEILLDGLTIADYSIDELDVLQVVVLA